MNKLLTCVILLAASPVYAAQSGCVGDCVNGTGTYYYADGHRYEGEWKDGEIDGQGTWYYSNGERYEGEWKLGRMDGHGNFSPLYSYPNSKSGKKSNKHNFYTQWWQQILVDSQFYKNRKWHQKITWDAIKDCELVKWP